MKTPPTKIPQLIPLYTPSSLKVLNEIISPDFKVLEFGSGHSTLWYGEKVKEVVSVEHNPKWHKFVSNLLEEKKLTNVDYKLVKRPYNTVAENYPDGYFDLIIIDGRDRVKCIKSSLNKLKVGGYLIFDNSDRKRYKEGIEFLSHLSHTTHKCYNPKKYGIKYPEDWTTTIYLNKNFIDL